MIKQDYNLIKIKKSFPKLYIEPREEQEFIDYLKLRGFYLYKQVYEALINCSASKDNIKYCDFKNFIRYDKCIRDKLYIFLAAAEEYLRNILYTELEIDSVPENIRDENLSERNIRKRNTEDDIYKSNLYYCSVARNFDMSLIEKLISNYELFAKYGLNHEDIIKMRKLRNKVMHHNMLLLSCYVDSEHIKSELREVEECIEALYRILPSNELKEGSIIDGKVSGGLTLAINKSNFKDGDINLPQYNNILFLHKFKNGRFIQ